jgi:hypothetical protein
VRGGAKLNFDKGGPVVMPSVDPMGNSTGMESLEAPENNVPAANIDAWIKRLRNQ